MYLSYTGIRVTDLDRSLKFYKDALGLEEVARGDNLKFGGGIFVLLRDRESGAKLELNWYPEGSKYGVPYTVGEGLDHLAFVVDDIKEAFAKLLEKGAAPTDFGPETGASYCYVKDPDGSWIELYQQKQPSGAPLPPGY